MSAKLYLILIVILGFLLRFYQLGDVPSGFHADEAAFGYNAYSIIHTGKDEYGRFLPLVLKSFGDYKGAIYAYLDVPSVLAFGLTPFAVRFPSALFGSLTIILVYLLVLELFKNKKIGIVSSFVFAILPWHIMISRTTGDVTVAMFFATLMAYGLSKILEKNRGDSNLWFFVSLLSATLSILSYAPYRIYIVIIVALFLAISVKRIKSQVIFNKTVLTLFTLVIGIGLLYTVFASIARFNQLSIFSNSQTNLVLEEQIREDQFAPPLLTRIFHNKLINYTRTILQNASQYFTFDYLFLNGGYPQRERIPNSGLFYIWEFPFLLIGTYVLIKRKKRDEILLVFWWILLLIPTFITFDEIPNVHRNLIVSPAMAAIIAVGINHFFALDFTKKIAKTLLFAICIFAIYEFSYFEHQYFVHQNVHQPWYRGFAYKALVEDLGKYYPEYKKIIFTKSQGSPYIYLLFYGKYDPKKYQMLGSVRDLDYTDFDKYYFVPLDCPLTEDRKGRKILNGEEGVLYVEKGSCQVPVNNARLLNTIRWQDNEPAFKLMGYFSTGSAKIRLE